MNWQQVCDDPNLNNLPYKIELNEKGQILMSPARIYHSALQGEIIVFLKNLLHHGKVFPECAIATSQGTKVADVVWCSEEKWQQIKTQVEASSAPEICIEVLSPHNTQSEIEEKISLYRKAGAKEVWICSDEGNLTFYYSGTTNDHSLLVPNFPTNLSI